MNENASFVENLKINLKEKNWKKSFPIKFSIQLVNLTKKVVSFVKIDRYDPNHAIGRSDVFEINSNFEIHESIEKELDKEDFELYKEINGTGFATLIRNKDSLDGNRTKHPFRIVLFLIKYFIFFKKSDINFFFF